MRIPTTPALLTTLLILSLASFGCQGREGSASAASGGTSTPADPYADAQPVALLESISPAIPVYPSLAYSAELTRQDNVNAERLYGPQAQIWTFSTANSLPKVWHYYSTWLGMFRGEATLPAFPRGSEMGRSAQIELSQAMQQPFIPGDEVEPGAHRVILELAETNTRARTVVRYIITPPHASQTAPVANPDAGV